ncbi:MAG: O-antigen ligase domain-containing protein [Desulfobacteraceae bacterium]|nr:O-antigen ligase domain-containing protein [Desulfobacteraceae bacterium]
MIVSHHKPHAWQGFLLLLTYIAIYFISQTVTQTRKQRRILVYIILSTTFFLSIFGIFKRFGINPFSFWEYEELTYNLDSLTSTYGNHNHMAGVIEMAFPFLLVLFLTRTRSLNIILMMSYMALIMVAALALTLSRGGWISSMGAHSFLMTVLFFHKQFKNRGLVLLISGVALAISILFLSNTPIVERIATVTQKDITANYISRIKAWEGTLALIKDNPYAGTGPGTYTVVFPKYQPPGLGVLFHNAHNDYLQFTADTGLFILPVIGWIVFIFFKTGFQNLTHPSRQTRGFSLAAMASVLAILIHSTSDFNMHIPANALAFTVIAGMIRQEDN